MMGSFLLFGILAVTDAQINIFAPYTFGTHELVSNSVSSALEGDPKKPESIKGRMWTPLSSFREGNSELECHFQESLGLDYEVSDFPKKHVCDEDERLPAEGPNALRFPEIELFVDTVKFEGGHAEVQGRLRVHGVEKPISPKSVEIQPEGEGLLVKGELAISLKDFDIRVKPFLINRVSDRIKIHLRGKVVSK